MKRRRNRQLLHAGQGSVASKRISYAARANRYARDVRDGKVAASRFVRSACQRHLDNVDQSKAPAYPYRFDVKAVDDICAFAENMVHIKGKWAEAGGALPFIRLEDWQCFTLGVPFGWLRKADGLRRFREMYAEIPRKNSKALAIDTPVPTPAGWSTMGELRVGDTVFGFNGMPRRITAATETMVGRPCFMLEMTDGERIVADADHLWLTDSRIDRDNKKGVRGKTSGPQPSVKTTEAIAASVFCRDELNHRIALPQPFQAAAARFDIDPYILGVWLGDGNSDGARVTIGEDDAVAMTACVAAAGERIQATGVAARYLVGSAGERSTDALGRFQSNGSLNSRLRRAGLLGSKHIPAAYLRGSEAQRMALLQGLMDTDGSISKAGQCSFTNTKKVLIDGIVELLFGLGFKPLVTPFTAMLEGREIGPAWKVQFWAFAARPCFRLPRKAARLREKLNYLTRSSTRQVIRCEPVASVPVRCIQVDAADGMFLVGRTFLPTHNSTLGAIIGLYMFCADHEPGAEVYAGATTMDQAYQVFRPAWLMVRKNPEFAAHFGLELSGTERNPGNIFQMSSGSRFEPLIGKPGDGASPHCAVIDEYHEHTSSELYDAMKTGMGARSQPMRPVITTAGTNTSGPCYNKHLEAVKVLDGSLQNEELFTVIYGIDVAQNEREPGDDWTDFGCWKKANPNFGVSLFEDYLRGQLRDAMQSPSQQNIILTKNLNQWMSTGAAWMNMTVWERQRDSAMRLDDFAGLPCWIAFDLASKIDIASMAVVFKTEWGTALFAKHYLPSETIDLPANAHYRRWRDEGWLTETEGARTDLRRIEDDLREFSLKFAVQELAFDQRESNYLVSNIQTWASFECVEVPQSPANFNEPMKEFEAQLYGGTMRHGGDPVLTWMMANVVKKQAHGGGPVKYYYPTKDSDGNKIDGIVAGIMALGLAMAAKEDGYVQGALMVV